VLARNLKHQPVRRRHPPPPERRAICHTHVATSSGVKVSSPIARRVITNVSKLAHRTTVPLRTACAALPTACTALCMLRSCTGWGCCKWRPPPDFLEDRCNASPSTRLSKPGLQRGGVAWSNTIYGVNGKRSGRPRGMLMNRMHARSPTSPLGVHHNATSRANTDPLTNTAEPMARNRH
jgi:hypothetical protein